MKEIYTKRITRIPDSLPVRSEKGIEVDSTDGKVTDIYVVDETGKKRIDLDGNVKESYSTTITENGTVTIDSAEYGEEYTSVKEVSVTVDCPTIDSAKEVAYTENGEYTISPAEGFSGIASATVTVNVPVQESKSVEYTENGEYTVVPDEGYDAVAEVTVTVDAGPITPTNPGAVSTLAELADYAKICDVYGAVLSVNNGQYLIWNDVVGSQTWNPSAIEETPVAPSEHGTSIAICIGDGVWVMTGWTGLTNSLKFAAKDTPLYSAFISACVKGSGKDNSDYILTQYASEIDSEATPLWDALKTLRETYAGAYIPNAQELRNICFKLATVPSESGPFEYNTNIAKVFGVVTRNYWGSSQYVDYDFSAYYVYFNNGYLRGDTKDNGYYSFTVLSFD